MELKVKNYVRIIAGFTVFTSAILGYYISRNWLFITIFVGFNLFQFGFSNKCPLSWMLKKIGIKE